MADADRTTYDDATRFRTPDPLASADSIDKWRLITPDGTDQRGGSAGSPLSPVSVPSASQATTGHDPVSGTSDPALSADPTLAAVATSRISSYRLADRRPHPRTPDDAADPANCRRRVRLTRHCARCLPTGVTPRVPTPVRLGEPPVERSHRRRGPVTVQGAWTHGRSPTADTSHGIFGQGLGSGSPVRRGRGRRRSRRAIHRMDRTHRRPVGAGAATGDRPSTIQALAFGASIGDHAEARTSRDSRPSHRRCILGRLRVCDTSPGGRYPRQVMAAELPAHSRGPTSGPPGRVMTVAVVDTGVNGQQPELAGVPPEGNGRRARIHWQWPAGPQRTRNRYGDAHRRSRHREPTTATAYSALHPERRFFQSAAIGALEESNQAAADGVTWAVDHGARVICLALNKHGRRIGLEGRLGPCLRG